MRSELVLALAIVAELLIFGIAGQNFFTASNAVDMVRLAAEVGLIALASTCVIVTGGIDLSTGSLMGLSAVVMGVLVSDLHVPVALAAVAVLLLGLACGGLNAFFIARFERLPLIVTLGTYSLYRGLAEGLTDGVRSFSGFPQWYLFAGRGGQFLVLLAAAFGFFWLLQRTTIGRGLYAIGHSPEGARFARIPVAQRLALVYLLSGLMASLAGVVYVARLGQAKADAGTGYELAAITAVVLGGTSIFGGSGTIAGTMLGLLAIVILQSGLRLAALPAELTGILTGLLLIATIALSAKRRRRTQTTGDEETTVKNSQVAVLSAVILAGAAIVAGSNWWLVRSLEGRLSGSATATPSANRKVTVAMMPKAKGDPYFISCRKGAEEAAREANVELLWDGPTDLDPAKQNEIAESWITRGVDAIAVSVVNREGISTVLSKARERGIKVITWDADAKPDARDFFVNQATPQSIGETLVDEAARLMNATGDFAVITGSLTAANQNEWIEFIKKRLEKYPKMRLLRVSPSDDDRDRAFAEAQTLMKAYPSLKLLLAIAAPAVPGAGEAVKQSGRSDVFVIGLSLPNLCKPYVHSGAVQSAVLWNTGDLGYLTVLAAVKAARGELPAGGSSVAAGRLGSIRIRGSEIVLGAPFIFNKSNIDRFDF